MSCNEKTIEAQNSRDCGCNMRVKLRFINTIFLLRTAIRAYM